MIKKMIYIALSGYLGMSACVAAGQNQFYKNEFNDEINIYNGQKENFGNNMPIYCSNCEAIQGLTQQLQQDLSTLNQKYSALHQEFMKQKSELDSMRKELATFKNNQAYVQPSMQQQSYHPQKTVGTYPKNVNNNNYNVYYAQDQVIYQPYIALPKQYSEKRKGSQSYITSKKYYNYAPSNNNNNKYSDVPKIPVAQTSIVTSYQNVSTPQKLNVYASPYRTKGILHKGNTLLSNLPSSDDLAYSRGVQVSPYKRGSSNNIRGGGNLDFDQFVFVSPTKKKPQKYQSNNSNRLVYGKDVQKQQR